MPEDISVCYRNLEDSSDIGINKLRRSTIALVSDIGSGPVGFLKKAVLPGISISDPRLGSVFICLVCSVEFRADVNEVLPAV